MPAKQGLPSPDVAVRAVDASDSVLKSVLQDGVELVEVPAAGSLIHQGSNQIGAVDGWRIRHCLPKLK